MNNMELLRETLEIMESGGYWIEDEVVFLKLSMNQMQEANVIFAEDVKKISQMLPQLKRKELLAGNIHVKNIDSFEAARELKENVLVLNFANPFTPGGGVRSGARAQEEDLCRKSTLLASLESKSASAYYQKHKEMRSYLATDALIVSPNVEIFRDSEGTLLKESTCISVVTCAAPVAMMEYGLSEIQYEKALYQRMIGILHTAIYYGYKNIVLGAWGCGAFGNDAVIMAELFQNALESKAFDEYTLRQMFENVYFAVLDRSKSQYNYRSFKEILEKNTQKDEETCCIKEKLEINRRYQDKFRGCLVGGAIGDALGMPIEFWDEKQIFRTYGNNGISSYEIDVQSGLAEISDDTQMTMFTANGILVGETRRKMRNQPIQEERYVYNAYLDWLYTQDSSAGKTESSWILQEPDLHHRREPGMSCLYTLQSGEMGTLEDLINDSKGCGGVMRVAPIGLYYGRNALNIDDAMMLGAKVAGITHGHPLGYIPSSALVHIINRIVYGTCSYGTDLYSIVKECRDTIARLFEGNAYLEEMLVIMDKAIELSQNESSDLENIHQLGEGWVAEEAFAISLYCSLRYSNDFSKAIITAVNHDGDSDSTGAITGNIVGAIVGYEAIEQKWKTNLELKNTILELADDLCDDCQMKMGSSYRDEQWIEKYSLVQRL